MFYGVIRTVYDFGDLNGFKLLGYLHGKPEKFTLAVFENGSCVSRVMMPATGTEDQLRELVDNMGLREYAVSNAKQLDREAGEPL